MSAGRGHVAADRREQTGGQYGNAADGTVTFSELAFTEKDIDQTYTYTIAEVVGSDQTIAYDNHTVELTVEIKAGEEEGTLEVTGTYSGEQEFKNKYT